MSPPGWGSLSVIPGFIETTPGSGVANDNIRIEFRPAGLHPSAPKLKPITPTISLWAAITVVVALNNAPARSASAQRSAEPSAPTVDEVYDVQYLLNLAEQGDARAAFLLGTRFATGRGGARDDSEAFRWFRKASEAGLAEAQYNLGIMYANGRGVKRNMKEAARWYKAAAEQGIAEAQFNIGTLYGLGLGVPRNETLAAEWLRKAAEKGLPQAQYNLGILYEHGRGVRLDAHEALNWYGRAADQGYSEATTRYASLRKKLALPAGAPPVETAAPAPQKQAGATPSAASPPATPVPPAVAEPAGFDHWIAGVEPDRYTLQLLSDTNEDSVRRYVAKNIAPGTGGYFATERDGQVWYSVVYGVFDNYSAAKAAAEDLPASLGQRKPWIRKVGSIQNLMIR